MFTKKLLRHTLAVTTVSLYLAGSFAPVAKALERSVGETNQDKNTAANLRVDKLENDMLTEIKDLETTIKKMTACQGKGGAYDTQQDACYPFEIVTVNKLATRGSFSTVPFSTHHPRIRPAEAPDNLEMNLLDQIKSGVKTVDVTIVPLQSNAYARPAHKVTLNLQSDDAQTGEYVTNFISNDRYAFIHWTFSPRTGWFRYYLQYTLADGGANGYIDHINFRWQEITLKRSKTPLPIAVN